MRMCWLDSPEALLSSCYSIILYELLTSRQFLLFYDALLQKLTFLSIFNQHLYYEIAPVNCDTFTHTQYNRHVEVACGKVNYN